MRMRARRIVATQERVERRRADAAPRPPDHCRPASGRSPHPISRSPGRRRLPPVPGRREPSTPTPTAPTPTPRPSWVMRRWQPARIRPSTAWSGTSGSSGRYDDGWIPRGAGPRKPVESSPVEARTTGIRLSAAASSHRQCRASLRRRAKPAAANPIVGWAGQARSQVQLDVACPMVIRAILGDTQRRP